MMKRRAANDASRTSTAGNRPPEPASVDAASSNNEPDKGSQPNGSSQTSEPASRASWDYMEEIVAMVKTTFPLLILSLETMVDQFTSRFKPSPEEDAYRMAGILLQEISQVANFTFTVPSRSCQLPAIYHPFKLIRRARKDHNHEPGELQQDGPELERQHQGMILANGAADLKTNRWNTRKNFCVKHIPSQC